MCNKYISGNSLASELVSVEPAIMLTTTDNCVERILRSNEIGCKCDFRLVIFIYRIGLYVRLRIVVDQIK